MGWNEFLIPKDKNKQRGRVFNLIGFLIIEIYVIIFLIAHAYNLFANLVTLELILLFGFPLVALLLFIASRKKGDGELGNILFLMIIIAFGACLNTLFGCMGPC
jgi:hypothetical protein